MAVTSPDAEVAELSNTLERVVTMVRRTLPSQPMSPTTVAVLRSLELSGPARLTELATAQGVTQPAMTQLVTRLERDAYVERGGSERDARVVLVSLTEAGREFLRHRRELRTAHLSGLLDRLPVDDRARILSAIPALNLLADLGQGSV